MHRVRVLQFPRVAIVLRWRLFTGCICAPRLQWYAETDEQLDRLTRNVFRTRWRWQPCLRFRGESAKRSTGVADGRFPRDDRSQRPRSSSTFRYGGGKPTNMPDFIKARQLADDAMRRGDFPSANDYYYAAWDDYSEKRQAASDAGSVREFDKTHPSANAFWLLLSGANAQFCSEDFEGCLDTCVIAFDLFKDLGYVVGNPFFHLRLGQASFELDPPGERDPAEMTIDNLARALICGGIEIYSLKIRNILNQSFKCYDHPKAFPRGMKQPVKGVPSHR